MSYLCTKPRYVIVDSVDLTEEMLNNMRTDFNVLGDVSGNSLRKSVDGTKCILKIKNPVSTTFNGYRWCSLSEIKEVLKDSEWVESE